MKKKETKPALRMLKWEEKLVPISDPKPCSHTFRFVDGECRCVKCQMGLMGVIDIVDGRPV